MWLFWNWFFFPLRIIPWELTQLVTCVNSLLFFISSISWYDVTTACLTIQPLKDTWIGSSFELL